MAINKDDFKNTQGNYEAKNSLIDALIDATNDHMAESATDDVHGLANAVIVESGSNQYGRYKKYGDGSAECHGYMDVEAIITSPAMGLYRSDYFQVTLPIDFINPDYSIQFWAEATGLSIGFAFGEGASKTSVAIARGSEFTTPSMFRIHYQAYGMWE